MNSLELLRRGPRSIIWTPEEARLGNFLYLWLHAFIEQERGAQVTALETEAMSRWRTEFPAIFESLVTTRGKVGIRDRRIVGGPLQSYGIDFVADELERFIDQKMVAASGPFARRVRVEDGRYDLTVNVRRGDYYSSPRWRGEYSFDVVEYVRTAVAAVMADEPITSIHVVSDDLQWCRIKLRWLQEIAPVSEPPQGSSAAQQLAMLAGSRRLVLANSTFSYWGGYLSQYFGARTSSPHSIWAPWFHNRYAPEGGRAVQLSDEWHIIESIPGGWDG